MDIKIGLRQIAREMTVNVALTVDDITAAYTKARTDDDILTLTDASGKQILIPARAIAYLEFGQEHARPVGFGTGA